MLIIYMAMSKLLPAGKLNLLKNYSWKNIHKKIEGVGHFIECALEYPNIYMICIMIIPLLRKKMFVQDEWLSSDCKNQNKNKTTN